MTDLPRGHQQRQAIDALLHLAHASAEREITLDKTRRNNQQTLDYRHDQLGERLTKRRQMVLKRHQQAAEVERTEAEDRFEEEFQALRSRGQAKLKEVVADDEAALSQVEKKRNHEAALVQAEYDEVERKLESAKRKIKDRTTSRRNELEEIRERAVNQLRKYRLKRIAKVSPEEPEPVQGDPKQAFADERAAAERAAHQLRRLVLARLVSGYIKPLIVIAALCAVSAWVILTQTEAEGIEDLEVQIALGGAFVVVFIIVALFKLMASTQARALYFTVRDSVEAGRAAADLIFDQAGEKRATARAEAEARRRDGVKAVRAKYEPDLRAVQSRLDVKRAQAQSEYEQDIAELQDRKTAALDRLNQDQTDRQAAIEARYDRRQALADARRRQQSTDLQQDHDDAMAALRAAWERQQAESLSVVQRVDELDRERFPRWGSDVWGDWAPPRTFVDIARFGNLHVDVRGLAGETMPGGYMEGALPQPFDTPALLAFPDRASLLMRADPAGRDACIGLLQAVMVRLLTSLPPGRVRFNLIDPVGLGQSFAGFMHLADHDDQLVAGRIWTDRSHIEEQLVDVTEHMENVIQKYLRNEYETIDAYNKEAGELAEPYRFVVVADFPHGFSEEAIRRLNSIAASGARCGVYLLILRDTREPMPAQVSIEDLEKNAATLVHADGSFTWRDEVFEPLPLTIESPPSEDFITRTCHTVGAAAVAAGTVQVPFDTIAPKPEQCWSRNSAEDLAVEVGRTGATRLQSFVLGHGVAQHALIAGKTGSGKSTLLHALITNLALWYAPDQVEFYLVDFKKGVEFKTYATHASPHAKAIAIESDREFGLSVLQRLDAELTRRGDLYRKLGVQDLAAFRAAQPETPMPRILMVVDEFQEFFSEEDKLAQDAALLIDRLVRQGRAFGIHMLLGSQSLGGAAGLPRTTMGQMAVRVALQCSEADSQLILSDNNSAARLLSRPGEAIYNDAGGAVENNSPFQVAWLPDHVKDEALATVRDLSLERLGRTGSPIVFEGNAPADIDQNALLTGLLDRSDWPDPASEAHAYIGEPVAIKAPTSLALRRQTGANVLVIGQQDEAAMAMMLTSLASLAAQHAPGAARFILLDGSAPDAPTAGLMQQAADAVPHDVQLVDYRGVDDAINELAQDVQRRQDADAHSDPAVYVLIYGLQRYRMFRKTEEDFSFSMDDDEPKPPKPDKQFAQIAADGPAVGVHLIAWCDTPIALERVVDRSLMREFDHRVLFQMSANDSSNLIDAPTANMLGFHRALRYSEEQGLIEKFRPYAMPSPGWIEQLKSRLAGKTAPSPL